MQVIVVSALPHFSALFLFIHLHSNSSIHSTAEGKIKILLEAYDDSEDVLLQQSEADRILLQKKQEKSSIVMQG
jgi:hypothetical protein